MGIEVERKFLVDELPPDLERYSCESIEQRYLVIGADGLEVRLRRRGPTLLMAVKHGVGLVRREDEFEIDVRSFERLWYMSESATIDKQRYRVPTGGVVVEVDVYGGALEGLKTAEVEFIRGRWGLEWPVDVYVADQPRARSLPRSMRAAIIRAIPAGMRPALKRARDLMRG